MKTKAFIADGRIRIVPGKLFWRAALAVFIGLAVGVAGPGQPLAYGITFSKGELKGSLDTTLSSGISVRVESRSPDLVGIQNGGNAYSINTDNGNLNFDQGDIHSLNVKVTHELDASYNNFGFFGRFYYFYDWAIMQLKPERTAFSENAQRRQGLNIRLMDAFLTMDFDVAGRPLTIRIGNQVLSWGESTFIQNGINVINPVDVANLRVAGAELRDALLPLPMISLNAGLTANLSIEGFYEFKWDNTEIEPEGTYFSTNDFASPGGGRVYLGFGLPPATDDPPSGLGARPPLGAAVFRKDDREAKHMGQGGVAFRYFADWLNDTELGLYYIHYHSRLPLLSGMTGTPPPVPAVPGDLNDLIGLIEYGLINGDYASTGGYFREFPEDIDMLGASFNTDIGIIGLALQGEVSWRPNQPIQVDDVELLYAALSPLDDHLRTLSVIRNLIDTGGVVQPPDKIFGNSQLGSFGFNEEVPGWRRKDMVQYQFTATKVFGPTLGTDQLVLLGEFGFQWIIGMDDELGTDGKPLRFEGPGTYTSANPWFTTAGIQPETQTDGFADAFSWGYRLAMRAQFNNAIGPVNLIPVVAWSHDVHGTSPSPVLNFIEGRKIVTVALRTSYLNSLRTSLSYTAYFGGGDFNLLKDRDFVSFSASYSF